MTADVRSEISKSLLDLTPDELALVQRFIRALGDKREPSRRDVRDLIRQKISAREAG